MTGPEIKHLSPTEQVRDEARVTAPASTLTLKVCVGICHTLCYLAAFLRCLSLEGRKLAEKARWQLGLDR